MIGIERHHRLFSLSVCFSSKTCQFISLNHCCLLSCHFLSFSLQLNFPYNFFPFAPLTFSLQIHQKLHGMGTYVALFSRTNDVQFLIFDNKLTSILLHDMIWINQYFIKMNFFYYEILKLDFESNVSEKSIKKILHGLRFEHSGTAL